jgi:hypothetical protein
MLDTRGGEGGSAMSRNTPAMADGGGGSNFDRSELDDEIPF